MDIPSYQNSDTDGLSMIIDDVKLTITKKGEELLTNRERQVLLLDATNNTGKQAAKELGISPDTVAAYNKRITDKLKTRHESINRSAMLIKAIAYGVLKVERVEANHELA